MDGHRDTGRSNTSHVLFRGKEMPLENLELDLSRSEEGQVHVFASATLKAKATGLCPGERDIQVRVQRRGKIIQIVDASIFDVEQNSLGGTTVQFTGKIDTMTPIQQECGKSNTAKPKRANQGELKSRSTRLTNVASTHLKIATADKVRYSHPKGTFPRILSDKVEYILQRVQRLPLYASRLLNLLSNETVSANEVVQLLKSDPSLVAMVMKLVNSGYYNLRNKGETGGLDLFSEIVICSDFE